MDTENIKNELVNLLKDKKAKDLISIDVKDVTTTNRLFHNMHRNFRPSS